MTNLATLPLEVGPKYDIGIRSTTWGDAGFVCKAGTYQRSQQLVRRQDVIAALQTTLSDRDLEFWTRVSQFDWSQGEGQRLFTNTAMYRTGHQMDVHEAGLVNLTDQPTLVANASGTACLGAGGCVVPSSSVGGYILFPWTTGAYTYATGTDTTTWTNKTTPAGYTLDIQTDASSGFFCGTYTGVWTTAMPPGNLTQYDLGANGPYRRLCYNPLTKVWYGIVGAKLHQINSGAGPTTKYDFVSGHLDAITYYNGNIVVAWNAGYATDGAPQSVLYQFDGTNMTILTQMPRNCTTLQLYSYENVLYMTIEEINILRDSVYGSQAIVVTACSLSGSTFTRLGFLANSSALSPAGGLQDSTGSANVIIGSGQFVYFAAGTYLWRYDTVNGGLSRVFGDETYPTASASSITGAAITFFNIVVALGGADGGVWQLTNSTTDTTSSQTNARTLTGSRWDLGLPYVDKYWDCFEVNFQALTSGQSITMEYSVDDGSTFTTCPSSTSRPNPVSTAGTSSAQFNIQQVSPSITYRMTLAQTSGRSTTVTGISARFNPGNPSLRVWRMTLTCYDNLRLRNNSVAQDVQGQDLIKFLFNISQQNETVTYYDANEPLGSNDARTPHTVWVMQVDQDTYNPSGTYNPTLQEGDVPIVLWEVDS